MKIFDMHVHIFPDRLAEKAASAIGVFYENFPMECDGRLHTALRLIDEAGITKCCAHSVATTAHQVRSINEFVLNAWHQYPDRIVPFAAMHPEVSDLDAEVSNILSSGFKGIKLHPEIQGFKIDAPEVLRMIEPFAGRIPLLIHAGDYRMDNSSPVRIKNLLRNFPNLTLICAHLGGWTVWEQAAHELPGADIYVDTSSALFALTPNRAVEIIRAFGVDRTLYGTDYPMWSPVSEMKRFDALPLSDEERKKIFWDNHLKLFPDET